MFRRILAASSAVSLVAGLTLIATSPALAESAEPVEPTTVELSEVVEAPAEPVVEAPAGPGVDGSPADPVDPIPPSDDATSDAEGTPEEETDDTSAAPAARVAMVVPAAVVPTVQQCATPNATTYVTPGSATATSMSFADTRSGGSNTLTSTGLQIDWRGPDLTQSKAAGYIPVNIGFESAGTPSMTYTVSSGASAGLNLTLFKDGSWFGNLVLEPLFSEFWINKAVPGMPEGPNPGYQKAYGSLDAFLAAFVLAGWDVDIRAIGYSGGSGSEGSGVVRSLAVGCDTYVFSAAPVVNAQCRSLTPIVVDDLADLDLSNTRSDGHNELQAGALRVWTGTATGSPDPRKAAGYLDVPDFPLTSTGTVALGWTGTTPPPGGQIVVDLDGDGTRDGILVFEPSFYGQNLWLASIRAGFDTTGAPAVGGGGGPVNGTIDQYLATWPNAKGLALGYSLGSGVTGDGLLTLIEAGCYRVTFDLPKVTNQQCSAFTTILIDDLADLDLSQTRSDGHNELVPGALRVWTGTATGAPDPRKAAGYLDVPDVPLSSTGTVALGWTGTTPPPGGQLVVDLDGDGTRDGILVFEPSFYGQNLWLASIAAGFDTTGAPTVGGGGGSINGSIDQYLANWPNAKILALGYSLGSGVTGDGKLTLLQAGCYQVRFTLLDTLPFPDPDPTNSGTPGAGGNGQLETLALSGVQSGWAVGIGALLLLTGLALALLAAVARRSRVGRG